MFNLHKPRDQCVFDKLSSHLSPRLGSGLRVSQVIYVVGTWDMTYPIPVAP